MAPSGPPERAVEWRRCPVQATVVQRASMPMTEMGDWLGHAYARVGARLAAAGAAPVGPPFARYEMHGSQVEVEAGFPVAAPVAAADDVQPGELPAGPVAAVLHRGPYDGLGTAHEVLERALRSRGVEPSGPAWETYLTDPSAVPDPADWRTEVVQPYREPTD